MTRCTSANGFGRGVPSTIPSWVLSAISATWVIVPVATTLADINPQNNPALNPNYPAAAPWQLTTIDWPKTVTAWNGSHYDPVTDTYYRAAVGGHGDNGSNQVDKCGMRSEVPAWSIVRPPSGAFDGVTPNDGLESTGVYLDGRPRSTHGYNGDVWTPSGLFRCAQAGIFSASGYRGALTWTDPVTGNTAITTTAFAPNNSTVDYPSACWDSVNNRLYWFLQGAKTIRYDIPNSGDMTAGAFSQVGSNSPLLHFISSCYLPDSNCVLLGNSDNAHGSSQWMVFDCATGAYYSPTFSGTATGLMDAGAGQPRWVPSLGAVCVWNNNSNTTLITRLTPPINPRTGTWVIDQLPVAGANAVTPSVCVINGTFGRFAASPNLGGFFVFNSVDGPHYFYKI